MISRLRICLSLDTKIRNTRSPPAPARHIPAVPGYHHINFLTDDIISELMYKPIDLESYANVSFHIKSPSISAAIPQKRLGCFFFFSQSICILQKLRKLPLSNLFFFCLVNIGSSQCNDGCQRMLWINLDFWKFQPILQCQRQLVNSISKPAHLHKIFHDHTSKKAEKIGRDYLSAQKNWRKKCKNLDDKILRQKCVSHPNVMRCVTK